MTEGSIIKTKLAEHRPDIYIGLVCAAGTDLTETKQQLQAQLSVVGYKFRDIRVSSVIAQLAGISAQANEHDRIKELMKAGDLIRSGSRDGDAVAAAVIAEIRRERGNTSNPSSTVYVIDSLKNPAEVDLLDQVFGRNYYTISIYLPKEKRTQNLTNKIAEDMHTPPNEAHEALAKQIIKDDEKGLGKKAQNVQDTFPQADYFVDGSCEISKQTQRFIELIFQHPFRTPSIDEYYMFLAKASAFRSGDLSRIVGASIVDPRHGVIATGCNEVPYPGGGIFGDELNDQIGDNRDHTKGHDPNYREIQKTIIGLIDVLKSTSHVTTNRTAEELADELLHGDHREAMKNARIRNLIEFGRVVHAEMHAITQAAAAGRSTQNCTLYCTTFPCHGCARHIISAGIAEVVFIEPYPKSLTEALYGGEIEMADKAITTEQRSSFAKVRFRPFHGIAPILYQRVFGVRQRKNDRGTIASWAPKQAIPVGAVFGVERETIELSAINSVAEVLKKLSLPPTVQQGETRDEAANSHSTDSQ